MKVRDVTVSVMIRVLKFSEGVVVRGTFHPRIVNADFFAGPQIVIHDHAPGTDDGHLANFPRLEPAALNGCKTFTGEGQRHVSHVFDSGGNMSISLAVNGGRKFVQDMQDDRDVVWSQVPSDINVLLE